jgi:hypothetical protein
VVVEGTADAYITPESEWREYEFKGKPGDLRYWPRQFAPYHLRLDWLMWFAGISRAYANGWFEPFVLRLLRNDRATLKLLRRNPFPDEPPVYVRARVYRYHYTTWRERLESHACWQRTLIGEFLPATSLARR